MFTDRLQIIILIMWNETSLHHADPGCHPWQWRHLSGHWQCKTGSRRLQNQVSIRARDRKFKKCKITLKQYTEDVYVDVDVQMIWSLAASQVWEWASHASIRGSRYRRSKETVGWADTRQIRLGDADRRPQGGADLPQEEPRGGV